jgi:hypothetical protein
MRYAKGGARKKMILNPTAKTELLVLRVSTTAGLGIENIQGQIGEFKGATSKALNTAIRVKGYNMMRLLQRQVRGGSAGGRRFAQLSFIARVMGHRGKNEPLKALSQAIKYLVPRPDPIEFRFGFVGPTTLREMRDMGARPSQMISGSWKRIALAQQAGFEQPVDQGFIRRGQRKSYGAYFARYGAGQLGKKRLQFSRARFFFLRKSTRSLRTPARPIIDPFWQAEQGAVVRDIRELFRRKMAGERI